MFYRNFLMFFLLSCGLIVNESHCQITLPEYQDTVFQYCDTIYYGWYSSERAMANGEVFQVYLGPLDNNQEGLYIEKNMWGSFFGTWACTIQGLGNCDQNKGDCYVHISLNDTNVSQYNLFYNGNEKYPCWWTTMYFYSKFDTLASPYIEMRDRTGELIPMYYVKISDINQKTILFQDQYGIPLSRCIIPPNAKYIEVSGKEPNVARGQCVYTPGSGNVTFVILPTANDHRLLLHKGKLEYHPLNQWCNPDNINVLNLLFENGNVEYRTDTYLNEKEDEKNK